MSSPAKKINPEDLEKALAYYKKRIDELGGENLKKDYEISGMRKEVTQKRKAFALLSELFKIFGSAHDATSILSTTIDRISATLGMDRVFMLEPSGLDNEYMPTHWAGQDGFDESFVATLKEKRVSFPDGFRSNIAEHLVVTSKTEPTDAIKNIQQQLGTPYFAAVPVISDNKSVGILLMGRMKEAGVLFPAMDSGDVETLQSISGLISSIIQNMRVGALQEMDRMKTEFFANVSHEFRTPITLTLGPLEGLALGRYGNLPDKAKEEVERMIRNQRRLLFLVNQILDLAKMEAGSMQLKAGRVINLVEFVKKRVEQFEAHVQQRGIELKMDFDTSVLGQSIYLDLEKFDKVVFNLMSNACKFTKKGHVKAVLRVQNEFLAFEVEDTGMGIRNDQIDKIFDRFKQADGSASREHAGTGIGLALVKQIVELHGGSIEVTSVYGQGTTFSVRIPFGKNHLPSDQVSEGAFEEQIAPQATFIDVREGKAGERELADVEAHNTALSANINKSVPTIVYADDNRDLREFVYGILKDEYNVFLAVNGKQGLELAEAKNVDLILSDLMMPVMTGTEFLKSAKESLKLQTIPFVILTAKASVDSKVDELERGADDYLNKPFSESELRARVRNLIKIRHQQNYIKRELQSARKIQQSLLPPKRQTFDFIKIESFFRPSEELSGDFFDTIFNPPWLYVYVADVMSHGTASAQITYMIKSIFQSQIGERSEKLDLPELMSRVAESYVRYKLDYSIGIQLIRINVQTGESEFVGSNAAHPLMIEEVKPRSIRYSPGPLFDPTFYDPKDKFEVTKLELKPGGRLFMMTDGCYEFIDPRRKTEFGYLRLSKILNEISDKEAWDEEVFNALKDSYQSSMFPDDITILRISFKA